MQIKKEKLDIYKRNATEEIQKLIYTIREKQVILDSDVAELYHYETKRINETVKRNVSFRSFKKRSR